jgi:hypothetical protein
MLRLCRVSQDATDEGKRPVHQVSYQGRPGDAVAWYSYGYHALPPLDTLALLLSLNGNAEARVILPGSPTDRPLIALGEVVIYHPATGAKLHFRASGDIEATPGTGAQFRVLGDFEVTGATTLSATVTSNGKDISDTHTHDGGTIGAGDTGPPN